jgi:hypothetical protein
MAAGILSGMEGKLNTRGWRWWVFSIFFSDFFSYLSFTGYSILKSVIMQVLLRHNLIVFQGAITIFVGLQAL